MRGDGPHPWTAAERCRRTVERDDTTRGLWYGVDKTDKKVLCDFAIVLDGTLVSVPYIDPQQNPDGIDGSDGSQISGSFTIR